ncbi:MAG: chromosome condensation regulator RCC1 [Actinobacteria bacterium]|nr:chromosome condensation regulator RCC1 [Actinomycetota bacterium]
MKRFLISSAILISVLGVPAQIALGDANEIATPSVNAGFQASISAGAYHTCAILGNGAVKCWGGNGDGQLGNRSNVSRSYPVQVAGLTAGVIGISAGWAHTCAVTIGGAAKCWGDNQYGQLGNGSNIDSNRPVAVRGLNSGVASISAGSDHTCAVLIAGGVKCWGAGGYGRLGDGSNTSSNVPLNVVDLGMQVKSIAAGGFHTCALLVDGVVKCWGWSVNGQLGNGSTLTAEGPVTVINLDEAVAIAAGSLHTCALTTAGELKCWGSNGQKQLGRSRIEQSASPLVVSGLGDDITTISSSGSSSCAMSSAGIAKCWGWNQFGGLGDGTTISRHQPVQVIGLTNLKAITVGSFHTCAVTALRRMRCWGYNQDGEVGNLGNAPTVLEPTLVVADRGGLPINNIGVMLPA